MSMLEPEDIAKWESEKMKNKTFEVEEIETIDFDENGKETETWKGYAVIKTEDPVNYTWECKNKTAADRLCEFLNSKLSEPVSGTLDKWEELLDELAEDEKKLPQLKEEYLEQEREIIKKTDFNKIYGANNDKVRKAHVKKELKDLSDEKENLEFKINDSKRRVSFLKAKAYYEIELMRIPK